MIHEEVRQVVEDVRIRQMRGGTIVTHAALSALRSALQRAKTSSPSQFLEELRENSMHIATIRAASIPLANGLRQVASEVQAAADRGAGVEELKQVLSKVSQAFERALDDSVEKIAEIGARRLKDGDVIMTHSYSSSVLAILKKAHRQGKRLSVIVTETRPELEGRDVARELAAEGIQTTLIIDSAIAHFMRDVDKVLVGAEAVAANGAIVNKIGTATIAAVAHGARVRVFVGASTYKFSPETMFGELIEIEERNSSYIWDDSEVKIIPRLAVRNPAFDVTSPHDIDLIVTELGVIPPQAAIIFVRERKAPPQSL